MIYVLLMVGVMLFVLLLLPTFGPAQTTAADTRRTELEEERELLLRNVEELRDGGADTATLTREKVRLAQLLKELDDLPPAPSVKAGRPVGMVSALALLGVLALLVVGSMTFLKSWRYSGLSAQEAVQLQNASRMPALQAKAERSKAVQDYMNLGDAAWDAQQYKTAAMAYTQVLLKKKDDAKALRRTGFFLLSDQQMAQHGLDFIARGATLAPKEPEGQLLYGYALGLAGQFQQALKVLNTYQQLAPGSHEADDLIVQYQQQMGAAVSGELVYAQNCAKCHGNQLQGGSGPKLLGAPALKNEAALRQRVMTGGMAMPAFPQLQGQQLDALVKYLKGF